MPFQLGERVQHSLHGEVYGTGTIIRCTRCQPEVPDASEVSVIWDRSYRMGSGRDCAGPGVSHGHHSARYLSRVIEEPDLPLSEAQLVGARAQTNDRVRCDLRIRVEGRVVDCETTNRDYVSVIWDTLPEGWSTYENCSPMMQSHCHHYRPDVQVIERPVVINRATPTEGEQMPEYATIRVPHTADTRQRVFASLDMTNVLVSDMDPQRWEQARNQLSAMLGDIEWQVVRGRLTLDSYPEARVGGTRVRIESVPLAVAQQFIEAASEGKVILTENHGVENVRRRVQMRPVLDLEYRAWELYNGQSPMIPISLENEVQKISLRTLRDVMNGYHQYFTTTYRRRYIQQALRERMLATVNSTSQQAEDVWNEERIRKFEMFLTGVKSGLQVEENSFDVLPMLPHKTLSSRPWGIEIEAPHVNNIETPEYWERKGDGSLRGLDVNSLPSRSVDPNYTVPPKFNPELADGIRPGENPDPGPAPELGRNEHDEGCTATVYNAATFQYGDCTCGYNDEYNRWSNDYNEWYTRQQAFRRARGGMSTETAEWNSPVLRSVHSRGLEYLTGRLEPRRVNDSAGVHVHVSASDLTPEQAVQLSVFYTALEPLFEKEYKRGATRNYCASVNTNEMIKRFRKMKNVKKVGGSARDMEFSSRYWTVNLAALRSHGTIEFRAMGPIYNYEHLVKWGYFCREMVNLAAANVPQSQWKRVKTMADLVTLFSKYGKETPTPSWAEPEPAEDLVAKVVAGLGSENRRYPHTQPLNPTAARSPRLVNDDYTLQRTFMLGERPESEVRTLQAATF